MGWSGPPIGLYASWIVACAIAELLGIALGGAWWFAMDQIDPEPSTLAAQWLALLLKSGSGLVEGTALGGLQALVLRHIYPALPVARWMLLTIALAVAGWAAGSAIPIFGTFDGTGDASFDPSIGEMAVFSGLLGAGLGAAFGAVQMRALRTAAQNSIWWVAVNAAGWALALPIIYFAASTGAPQQAVATVAAKGVAAGLVAGLVLGATTGLAFWRMPPT